jgi:hypothetical protein
MYPIIETSNVQILTAGGAAACRINAAASKELKIAYPGKPYYAILISTEVKALLTTDELEAIIAHEEGHIACGHLKPSRLKNVKISNGIVDDKSMELEADAYAAKKLGAGGAKRLSNALGKVVKFLSTKKMVKLVLIGFGKTDVSDLAIRNKLVEVKKYINTSMKCRFDALASM